MYPELLDKSRHRQHGPDRSSHVEITEKGRRRQFKSAVCIAPARSLVSHDKVQYEDERNAAHAAVSRMRSNCSSSACVPSNLSICNTLRPLV